MGTLGCVCAAMVRWLAAQVETGSAITWKYPSVVLRGDNSVGEFYSVALTNNYQQARSFACVRGRWGGCLDQPQELCW